MFVSNEFDNLKFRIEDFLRASGVEYDPKRKSYHCPNPNHADEQASAHLYRDSNRLYCPVCADKPGWDVFDVAGFLTGENEFPKRREYVERMLGAVPSAPPRREPAAQKPRPKKPPVSLPAERAKSVYTVEEFQRRASMSGWGTFAASWEYRDLGGAVIAVDVRFERDSDEKTVVTFWYDGRELRTQGAPVLVNGLDRLVVAPELPVLVVEGCKTAEAASAIPGFVVVTWSGGTGKIDLADWSPLAERAVYIWPDDDQKKDKKTGELKPQAEQPGIKAAMALAKRLPHAKVIVPPPRAREIKPDGADAVEALQVYTPAELAEYIVTAPAPSCIIKATRAAEKAAEKAAEQASRDEAASREHDAQKWPFTILGISDDGRMGVIGREDRLDMIGLSGLTKTNLLNMAPLEWWEEEFGYAKGKNGGRGIKWDAVISHIIGIGRSRDFDTSQIRGRGAWREKDGRICYHDGRHTIGDVDPRRLYIRRPMRDIGITGPELDAETCKEIEATTSALSFETPIDHVRLLGWSILAPFAGALPWRPAILLTGDSGSGKSTIIDHVVARLAEPVQFSGGESTEPGVRQRIGIDATGVAIDEAECDTEKKKRNREALLSLMRQSTSDDAPIVAKGTVDGKGLTFQLRSMFLFAAISPDVAAAADDNRIFRINLKRPDSTQWPAIRSELERLVTPENCAGVRARTWKRLGEIIKTAYRFARCIQDVSGRDARYSLAEAMLQAAYWIVLRDRDLSDDELREQIASLYGRAPQEPARDENEEMLDTILDEVVTLDDPRRTMTLREVLLAIRDGQSEAFVGKGEYYDPKSLSADQIATLRGAAGRYGVSIASGELAIAKNHDALMRILQRGRGYHRQLCRHHSVIEQSKIAKIGGKSRDCVTLRAEVLG